MKEYVLPVIFVTLALAGGVWYVATELPKKTKPYFENQISSILIRDVAIDAKIADSDSERVHGLSGTTKLGDNEGLLLVFDTPGYYGIWMKDMNYDLDIIWIDENLKIVHMHTNVSKNSFPTIFEPPVPARMALEVNARFAATYKFQVGDTVRMNEKIIPPDIKEKLKK
jgi:uncharacterized membrane protein (UPF0127 family)